MPSVILVVFIVQLLLSLISTVGAQAINDLAWYLFTLLPTPQSRSAQGNLKLRREVVQLEREMRSVSAQDEFARWAKLRRQHDKAKEKYEKEASSLSSFRSTFMSIVSKLRWLGTQGVNFLLNTYYSKTPMFYLPQGWVPYYAEWLLSFPRAPIGGVSVNVWAIACGSVIGMVMELVVAALALKKGDGKPGEKVKIPANTPAGVGGRNKEL
ncbi:Protein GET1 [Cercospora zeina]